LLAEDAVKQKLADRMGTFDAVLESYGVKSTSSAQASEKTPEVRADIPNDMDDDDLCECSCEQCAAGNHPECTNEQCSDPNCNHAGARGAQVQKEQPAPAVVDYMKALQSRRRQLQLL
jgi:hypothetical protein